MIQKGKSHRENVSAFVDRLQASGRYTFERAEARSALKISDVAFKAALRRLVAKGRICAPRRGFYVIVPIEYSRAGAPPASWFIDALMRFHRQPYYVGLLSAAALHGAAHQQPQEFQVVSDAVLRPVAVGRSRIRFFLKLHLAGTPTTGMKTETGSMRVSSPEATALDLVRYSHRAGQLGNVATVLAGLCEKISPERLVEAARHEAELSIVQRLGFLLERFGSPNLTGPLASWLAAKRPRMVPLRPERNPKANRKDSRWKVLLNQRIEAD